MFTVMRVGYKNVQHFINCVVNLNQSELYPKHKIYLLFLPLIRFKKSLTYKHKKALKIL